MMALVGQTSSCSRFVRPFGSNCLPFRYGMMGSTQQIMVNHLQLQTNLYSHPRSYSYSPFANPAGDSMNKAGQIGLGILFIGGGGALYYVSTNKKSASEKRSPPLPDKESSIDKEDRTDLK